MIWYLAVLDDPIHDLVYDSDLLIVGNFERVVLGCGLVQGSLQGKWVGGSKQSISYTPPSAAQQVIHKDPPYSDTFERIWVALQQALTGNNDRA